MQYKKGKKLMSVYNGDLPPLLLLALICLGLLMLNHVYGEA